MMTTKRFTRCKDECKVKVYDEVTQEIIPSMKVVELMNELYKKNKDGEERYRQLLEKYEKLLEFTMIILKGKDTGVKG